MGDSAILLPRPALLDPVDIDNESDDHEEVVPERANSSERNSQPGEWISSTVTTMGNNGTNLGEFNFAQVFEYFDKILDDHNSGEDDGRPLPIDAPTRLLEQLDSHGPVASGRDIAGDSDSEIDSYGSDSDDSTDPLDDLANMETMFYF